MIRYAVVSICGWLLDLASTFVGLSLGYAEAHPGFLTFPATWILLIMLGFIIIYLDPIGPRMKKAAYLYLAGFSFIPGCFNTIVICGGLR